MSNKEENETQEILENNILDNNITLIDMGKIQNDLLLKLKELKKEIYNKFEEEKKEKEYYFENIRTKFLSLDGINKSFTDSLATINVKLDKLNEIEIFKKKSESQIITHEIRINNLMEEYKELKFKYDKIIIDNLTVPGYIGGQGQYKTLGDYIYFNIQNVSSLNSAKEQMRKDIKELKNKTDNMVKEIITIVNSAEQRSNMYCDNKCKNVEIEFKLEDSIINEKIMEVRINNVKEAQKLEKRSEEMEIEWKKILDIKKEIEKKLGDHLLIYKMDAAQAIEKYKEGKIEFDKVKQRFGNMVDFIKDIRFRRNLGNLKQVKKRDISNLVHKLDFNNHDSIHSDELKNVDLDYNFKTGKSLNLNISEDEGEFEKKKKVKKLVKKLTSHEIDYEDESKNKENMNSNYIKNNNSKKNVKSSSKNLISESEEEKKKRINSKTNSPIEGKIKKPILSNAIKNQNKFEKDNISNKNYMNSVENEKMENQNKNKVIFELKKFPTKKRSTNLLNKSKLSSNYNNKKKESNESELLYTTSPTRSKSGKVKMDFSQKEKKRNSNDEIKEKKIINPARKLTAPYKQFFNPIRKNKNVIKKINEKEDKNIEKEDNNNNNEKENIDNNNIYENNINDMLHSNDDEDEEGEDNEMESSISEKKIENSKKDENKSFEYIKQISKNEIEEYSIKSIEKKDKKENNLVNKNNMKKIEDKNLNIVNSNIKTIIENKISQTPNYKRKSVMKIEKQIIRSPSVTSENNINNTLKEDNSLSLSEKILIEEYLRSPINKKFYHNLKQFNKTFSNNSIIPKLSSNHLISEIKIKNKKNFINLKQKNNINDKRPKDYDPDFNFNLVQLGIKNIPSNSFYKNYKFDNLFKNDILSDDSNKVNITNYSFNNNYSKSSFNFFQKDFIESSRTKISKKILNFNDILPPTSNKKIKFIKIGKTNYKDE